MRCSAVAAAPAASAIPVRYPLVELVTALLVVACALQFGLDGRRARRRRSSAPCSSPSRRSTSSTGSSRTGSSLPASRRRARGADAARTRASSGCSRRSAPPSSCSPPRSPTRAGLGMGDVKLALLLGAMLGRNVAVALMVGLLAALVPAAVLAVTKGVAAARKTAIPFAPFLAFGGLVALFAGERDPRLVPRPDGVSRGCGAHELGRGCRYLFRGMTDERDAAAGKLRRRVEGAARRRRRRGIRRAASTRSPTWSPTCSAATELSPADRLAAARGRAGGGLARAGAPSTRAREVGRHRARARAPPRPAVRRPRRDAGLARCRRADPAAHAEARRRGPGRARRRPAAGRGRRPGEHPRHRRAAARRRSTRSRSSSASREDIIVELERLARQSEVTETQSALDELEVVEEDEDDLEVDDGVSDAPLVRLVNSIIMQAAADGASDIHFEPQEDALVVRARVDGVLTELQRIPKRMAAGVTTRLKVLAKLDIAERRKPQDGRISLNAPSVGRMLDIRVAVLPTVEGEQVVMRLIDKSRKTPTLESLGLSETMREQISRDHPQADRRAARHRARRARASRRRSTPRSPRSTGPRSTSSRSRTRSSTGCTGSTRCRSTPRRA